MAVTDSGKSGLSRVVLVAMNEVTHQIIEELSAAGNLPNFARLDRTWERYTTTSEERQEWLEPWIQWPTVHTGKRFGEHGLFKLGDCQGLRCEQIWERLGKHGIESCVIGSMNATRGTATRGVFIPDWWGSQRDVHPPELLPLWTMLSFLVQGHATARMTLRDTARLLRCAVGCGLPLTAYADLAGHAIGYIASPKSRWKSAGALDLLVFQLFSALWSRGNFGFGTVFLNAVAHYQHHYWRSYDPRPFGAKVTYSDLAPGDDPVSWGYTQYDRIVARIIRMAEAPDTLVILATALSQAPYTGAEEIGGEHHYRVADLGAFLGEVGLEPADGSALMSRDFRLKARDAAALNAARQKLLGLTVSGEQLFNVTELSNNALAVSTRLARKLDDDAWILNAAGYPVAPFSRHFRCTAIKSGFHNGTGTAWFSRPVRSLLGADKGSTIWLGRLFDVTVDTVLS